MNPDQMAIEVTISQAKKSIKRMNALLALQKNKDYIFVIEEGYFQDETRRVVNLKADVNMASDEQQQHIIRKIDGIGELAAFLEFAISHGQTCLAGLAEHENTLNEIIEEESF